MKQRRLFSKQNVNSVNTNQRPVTIIHITGPLCLLTGVHHQMAVLTLSFWGGRTRLPLSPFSTLLSPTLLSPCSSTSPPSPVLFAPILCLSLIQSGRLHPSPSPAPSPLQRFLTKVTNYFHTAKSNVHFPRLIMTHLPPLTLLNTNPLFLYHVQGLVGSKNRNIWFLPTV